MGSGGQEGSEARSAPRRTCGRAVLPGWWRRERRWQQNAAVDRQRREVGAVAEPPVEFAGLLRKLRREARLTQEELAEAAGVSLRAVSYLERGVVTSPQKDTVRLLADALGLIGPARAGFEAAARGRAAPGGVAAATRTLPRDIASFTGRQEELAQLAQAAAGTGGVVAIHAIGGMAGVGKTAFAVHAAHRLAGRFPGGEVFLPLERANPGPPPVGPAG